MEGGRKSYIKKNGEFSAWCYLFLLSTENRVSAGDGLLYTRKCCQVATDFVAPARAFKASVRNR